MRGTDSHQHTAGIIGRTLRLMLGLLIAAMTYLVVRTEDQPFRIRLLVTTGAIVVFYAIFHLVVRRFGRGLHRWGGAILAMVPLALLFALGGRTGQVAVSAYVGLAFLLQTARGEAGCEAVALPAAVFRRPTHLMGILFAPVDFVEKHLTGPGGLPG